MLAQMMSHLHFLGFTMPSRNSFGSRGLRIAALSPRLTRSNGFTLVELLVGVAILGVLLALAAPSLADFINRKRVETVAAELATDLAYARTEAAMRAENILIRFNSDTNLTCYSITYTSGIGTCDCRRAAGTSCGGGFSTAYELKINQLQRSSGVTMTPSQAGSPFGFIAPRLTASDPNFFITVAGTRGATLVVRTNAAGRVITCSPSGSGNISGYQTCPATSS